MIPSTSRAFVLTNLVPGLQYDLCVLAVWDDAATALTATNVVGCAQFTTGEDFPRCQSLRGGFLGGTMILVVGGVVVATLLVFIVVLMVRYKATGGGGGGLAVDKLPDVSNTYSQTNGGLGRFNGAAPPPPSQQVKSTVVVMREEMVEFKCGSLQSSLSSSSSSSNSLDSHGAGPGRRGAGSLADRYSVQGSECSTLPSSKFRRHGAKGRPNLDHLLGAFASLELRGAAARDHHHHQGAASPLAGTATAAAVKTDKEPLLGRAESTSMLARLLGLPQEVKPKRSRSFDMGHVGAPASGAAGASAQVRGGNARRISNIWTKRSLSVNGMLLQYDETEDEKPAFESSEWVMESTV